MGGWSKTNDAVPSMYIDLIMSETPAAWLFFG
jgi:hypothetical protein